MIAPSTPRARLIRAIADLEHVHAEDVLRRIDRLRTEHGATDRLIAEALGVHRNTIVKWRGGQTEVSLPRAVGLALLLLEHQITRGERP